MPNPSLTFTLLGEPAASSGPVGAEVYARMLKLLLPPGKVWNLLPDSLLSAVLLAAGDELARIHQRALDLLVEADPAQVDELLEDWERVLDLEASGTDAERRSAVAAALNRRPRFRPADFQQALAPVLGLDPADVIVTEQTRAFAVSVSDDREIYRFFIYRNPALPGSYDLAAAQAIVNQMKPSHTAGFVIAGLGLLCDDPGGLCDIDILGV